MRLNGHFVLIIPDDLRGRALSETILFLDSYSERLDFQVTNPPSKLRGLCPW